MAVTAFGLQTAEQAALAPGASAETVTNWRALGWEFRTLTPAELAASLERHRGGYDDVIRFQLASNLLGPFRQIGRLWLRDARAHAARHGRAEERLPDRRLASGPLSPHWPGQPRNLGSGLRTDRLGGLAIRVQPGRDHDLADRRCDAAATGDGLRLCRLDHPARPGRRRICPPDRRRRPGRLHQLSRQPAWS